MKYKLIIFDLDGTLLDTLEDLADSFNYALRQFGFPDHPTKKYKFFVGDGAQTAMLRSLPESSRSEQGVKKVLAVFAEHYATNYNNKTQPYTGINELLANLKSQNVKLAVLSNKPHDFTVECVKEYFPNTFDEVFGVSERFDKKPAPDSTLYLLKQFACSKEQALFVGDTKTDMETAKNAGLKAVGVSWGFRDKEELQASGADFIISNADSLIELI